VHRNVPGPTQPFCTATKHAVVSDASAGTANVPADAIIWAERRSRTNSVSSQTKPRSRTNSVSTPSKGEFIDPLGFKRGVPSGHAIDMKNYKPSDQCHTEEDARRFEAKTKLLVGKELAWETAYDPAAKVV